MSCATGLRARTRVVEKRVNAARWAKGLVVAALLLRAGVVTAAPASSPPPPPPPVQTETPRAEEPGSGQRERFHTARERLREIGDADGYANFAAEAEREAERRREAALARGAAARASGVSALEEKMFQQTLREAGLLGEEGCFKSAPDFSRQRDLFRYPTRARLVRGDFQKRGAASAPAFEPGERPDAALFIVLGCTLEVFVEEATPGVFTARLAHAEIFALASRARSRWNPARGRAALDGARASASAFRNRASYCRRLARAFSKRAHRAARRSQERDLRARAS